MLTKINETGGDFGAQDKKAETGNLTTNDFDTIIREYAPYSFDEATVRLQSAAEDGGNVPDLQNLKAIHNKVAKTIRSLF
jgi:hypothetical protein